MAEAPEIQPILGTVNQNTDTVQGQLTGLLDTNSDYMKQAQTQAQQASNKRGLLNSSMAATAGQAAAIQSALPIAQQDAKTYADQNRANTTAQNSFLAGQQNFGFDTAKAQQQFDLQSGRDAQLYDYDINKLNTQADLQTQLDSQKYQAELDRDLQASQLDLAQNQSQHQQEIEKYYLQAVSQARQAASSDAALIGRTEGLTATQQNTAMNRVYDQAELDIDYLQSVFSQPQSWNW